MLNRLLKLANKLDQKGYYDEAAVLDDILKLAVSLSNLTRALKNDSKDEAMRALTDLMKSGEPAKELRMTDDEFREFANALRGGDLEGARKMYGMETGVDLTDTSKYSPLTGQPWASGPVQFPQRQTKSEGELRDLIKNVVDFVRSRGGKIVKATSEGTDNLLRIEFGGLDEDAQREFEDVYGGGGGGASIRDSLFGYGYYNAGIIDDGPKVGIEVGMIGTGGGDNVLKYIKDLLKG